MIEDVKLVPAHGRLSRFTSYRVGGRRAYALGPMVVIEVRPGAGSFQLLVPRLGVALRATTLGKNPQLLSVARQSKGPHLRRLAEQFHPGSPPRNLVVSAHPDSGVSEGTFVAARRVARYHQGSYVAGIDWGRQNDSTVTSVVDVGAA